MTVFYYSIKFYYAISLILYDAYNVGRLKSISTADNEAYGVLREGGVSQPIELKDNAYTLQ